MNHNVNEQGGRGSCRAAANTHAAAQQELRPPERCPRVRSGACVVATCLAALLATGCSTGAYKITPIPADRTLEEEVLINEGGLAPPKIALLDIDGVLVNAPKWSLLGEGEHPVSLLLEKLDRAARDSAVKGVVLRINSPGGSVTIRHPAGRESSMPRPTYGETSPSPFGRV